jgi:DEAD/DEAH box helicase domain-containing protein
MGDKAAEVQHNPEDGQDTEHTSVLPYRSGYETEDRERIQRALTSGELAGVVSTSALELGLDIGEVDVVVLVDVPPSVKAFWQRLGRPDAGTQECAL